MKTWIKTKPVLAYYGLAVTLSWAYWFTLMFLGESVGRGSSASHFPGLLGPAIAALIITGIMDGKAGVKILLARCVQWKGFWPNGLLVVLAPLLAGLAVLGIMHVSASPFPDEAAFRSFPGLPASWPMWLILLSVLVFNGYGEEIGWRGFVTEYWLAEFGPFWTSLRVAGLWMFWHLPLFLLNLSMHELIGPMLLGWAFALVCGTFVMTFIYLNFGRSLLVPALWHLTFNMMTAAGAVKGLPAAIVSTMVMIWGVVIAVRWWKAGRLGSN